MIILLPLITYKHNHSTHTHGMVLGTVLGNTMCCATANAAHQVSSMPAEDTLHEQPTC